MATGAGRGPSGERVWFLADAHLEPSRERPGAGPEAQDAARQRDLLELLASLTDQASHLYLVGDIFDFWFEYVSGPTRGHEATVRALRALSDRGISVHFLGGNHDYWAGRVFEHLSGARVHRVPLDTTHCGRRLFIAHGDGLPEGDLRYKALKALIRSAPAIAAFRLLPPTLGASIGRWASGLSEITDERIERAMRPMRDFLLETVRGPYDAAIVGHVHRPAHWRTPDGDALIVGDWQDNRSALLLDGDGFHHFVWRVGALHPQSVETSNG